MKKYAFLAILFGALTFISCSSKSGSSSSDEATEEVDPNSVVGTWQADQSTINELMKSAGGEITDADVKFKFDKSTMHLLIDAEGESRGIGIGFAFDMKFSYTQEDDVIDCEYKDCDAEVTKLELSSEIKSALAAQGMSESDLKEEMEENFLPQMTKEMGKQMSKEVSKMDIKELNEEKLVLKEGSNTFKLKRIK